MMAQPTFDPIGVLGHVGWLLARDAETRDLFISDLEWRVMPPVALNQFKIWHAEAPNGGGRRPVAYASWAFVGDRQKARLDAGNTRLAPGEWKSGNHKVIIDIIAPFGGKEKILGEVDG